MTAGDVRRYAASRDGRKIELVGGPGGFVKRRGYRVERDEVVATLGLSDEFEDHLARLSNGKLDRAALRSQLARPLLHDATGATA